jgi:hypothetical protein
MFCKTAACYDVYCINNSAYSSLGLHFAHSHELLPLQVIPNTKMELEEWEHVTCLKNVSLAYEGTRSGLKGYIAVGTNYNYGEDITSRGRVSTNEILAHNLGHKVCLPAEYFVPLCNLNTICDLYLSNISPIGLL